MGELEMFLKKLTPNVLGELLHQIVFIGRRVKNYNSLKIRPDATEWSDKKVREFINECCGNAYDNDPLLRTFMPKGYTFAGNSVIVDVCWYWKSEKLHLLFRVREGKHVIREIINCNYKKVDNWKDQVFSE